MNFYKHFIGDYARDTAHLTVTEHGAYRLMLDHYYATGKPLPADSAALARICGAVSKAERQAVAKVADQFFPLNGDGHRHNKRADREIAAAHAYAEAQAQRANKRWHVPTDMPSHMRGQCPDDASHSQIPQPEEKPKSKSKAIARSAGASSPVRLGEGPEIEAIPIAGGTEAVVCQSHVAELERLYPGVDVPQTLKEIRGWNLANPTRRKTRAGVAKHINSWCAREQNKA